MKRFDSDWFAKDIRFKKGNKPLSIISTETGVSKATLSRLQNKKVPDIETYYKLCKWIGSPLEKYFISDMDIPPGGFRAKQSNKK